MALCANCFRTHSRWRDKAHTKPAAYCAKCHAKAARRYRTKAAVKRGKLIERVMRRMCPACQKVLAAIVPRLSNVPPEKR